MLVLLTMQLLSSCKCSFMLEKQVLCSYILLLLNTAHLSGQGKGIFKCSWVHSWAKVRQSAVNCS